MGSATVGGVVDARMARLSRRIAELALREGWARGRHVTEMELVAALGVSRTPVRAALRLLEQHGVVLARSNRGFVLRRSGAALARFDVTTAETAEDELYGRLLCDRLSGSLPMGVTQAMLAERYSAGRSVLERVLARLLEDGLALRGAGRGWSFVTGLADASAVAASYQFRAAVEPAALMMPTFAIDQRELFTLRSRHEEALMALGRRRPSRASTLFALDAGFHETLAAFSANPFVMAAVRQQNGLRRFLEYGSYHDIGRVKAWCLEHLGIIHELEKTMCETAAGLLRAHLQRAATVAAEGSTIALRD